MLGVVARENLFSGVYDLEIYQLVAFSFDAAQHLTG